MAWTEPKTWTDGSAITAGDLNEQVRDNLDAASTAQSYSAQLLSVPGPQRSTVLQGVYQSAHADSYAQYVQAGDVVYFEGAIYLNGNSWTDPLGVATTGSGEGFAVITTPSDIGVLLTSRVYVGGFGQGHGLEAGRLDMDPYQDFTGRNGITIGVQQVGWDLQGPFLQNPKVRLGPWATAGSVDPVQFSGSYITSDSLVAPAF